MKPINFSLCAIIRSHRYSYERYSLISVCCQCSMRTAFTGNTAEEVFNIVIVNRRFVLLFLFKHQFRHGLGTGIVLKVQI